MSRSSYKNATRRQIEMARKFSNASQALTLSQALKYLNECFQLAKGDMDEAEFEKQTGHKPHTLRF